MRHVCFRLLAQLRDMEEAFDGFFEKHHLKLQQYLQLLQYEMSFQQVRGLVFFCIFPCVILALAPCYTAVMINSVFV